jgi:hypothetical protein
MTSVRVVVVGVCNSLDVRVEAPGGVSAGNDGGR